MLWKGEGFLVAAKLDSLTHELTERQFPDFFFKINQNWVNDFQRSVGIPVKSDFHNSNNKVPQVFLACLRDADFYLFDVLGIELAQLLHTTQRFEYLNEAFVGDEIRTSPRITRVLSKRKSANPFVLLEITTNFYRNQEVISRSITTLFVREMT